MGRRGWASQLGVERSQDGLRAQALRGRPPWPGLAEGAPGAHLSQSPFATNEETKTQKGPCRWQPGGICDQSHAPYPHPDSIPGRGTLFLGAPILKSPLMLPVSTVKGGFQKVPGFKDLHYVWGGEINYTHFDFPPLLQEAADSSQQGPAKLS